MDYFKGKTDPSCINQKIIITLIIFTTKIDNQRTLYNKLGLINNKNEFHKTHYDKENKFIKFIFIIKSNYQNNKVWI